MTVVRDILSANGNAESLRLAPLDIPLRVQFPAEARDTIIAACRGWQGGASCLPASLRLRVEQSRALSGTGSTEFRFDGARTTVRGPGVVAQADIGGGFANCAVSAEYLEDAAALQQEVLEPLVLMLLSHRDRTPLHASAFIVDGVAILLAGHTGAGKSCLARAADAAGHQVLSDDTVFVQLTPRLTVWGWPTAAHLLSRDAPDAAGPTRLRNGTVKQVVPLRSASQAAIACNRAVLCLLSHAGGGEPALSPVPAAAVKERLWPLDEGFDLLPEQIARAVARLSADGAWSLRLSADPRQAVCLLAASLPRLTGAASAPPG
jgi:hypothetical protein